MRFQVATAWALGWSWVRLTAKPKAGCIGGWFLQVWPGLSGDVPTGVG
jgi:hypothetical protein